VSEIKVSDRRMFTPDGRLREEYERELAQAASEPEPAPQPEPQSEVAPPPAAPAEPAPAVAPAGALAGLELPAKPPPGLLEHVEFLAQLALVAMGEMPLPDGRLARDLDGARFYVDLIGLFHQRYGASLGPQEARFLESYLDQLRLRYVAHRG
jgi:hypothetical protein